MVIEDEKINTRRATLDDAVLISVLASATFYEAYFEQDESENLAAYIHESFEIETVRSELAEPGSIFFIALQDGKAVGYARLIENSPIDCIAHTNIIELRRIWPKGRGFENLWLGVWEENIRAQRFYAKFGFRNVGSITFPYGDVTGTNLVLEKALYSI